MSAYRPYPKTKPSGVEWLGDVPVGWEVKRFKGILKEREERSKDGSETLLSVSSYTGVTPRSELIEDGEHLSRADSLEGYKKCYENDLVMNIMLAWNRGLAFTKFQGIVSPAYCVFHVIDGSAPNFLNYLVRSDEYTRYFKAFSTGVIDSRLRIYPETFGSLLCLLPPLPEQIQIATFLDRECGKLDALQAKQERLIELLKEKRQALISHTVTKGLDPNAKLKPSGIEWLGDVPEHWVASKVKWVSQTVKTGGTPSDASWFTEEPGVPWLTPGDFSDESFKISARRFVTLQAIANREAPLFPPSAVFVVGIGATLGKVARLDQRQPASSNQQINAIVPSKKVESDFLLYSLLAQSEQMKNCSNASTLGIMNQEKTKGIHLALPTLAEQRAIVAYLDDRCGRMDALIAKAERAIALLKERRSALISAAVTGKIDVRDV